MCKFKKTVLILCFILSGALCFASGVARTDYEKGDGIPIEIIEAVNVTGLAKGNSIHPSINGHYLTVVFTENLGQVTVEVTTASGAPVDGTSTITPTGIQIYIPNTGDYIVTFTLPNGDEYYGEFTVTD